jgi:hypothetical protein
VVAATAVALVVAGVGGRRYQAIWLGGAMLGVIGMFIALLYFDRTRCPKCLARIGPYNSNFNYCPQCGVRLDTPAPLPR